MPDPASPRRQQRGLRRIAQLLEAAAAVFGEVGYEAATTNAIAARAGVSPGTLYQFFGNKEALAEALAERYTTELSQAQAAAFESEPVPLLDRVDRIVDALLAFNLANPGFKALFETRPDMPERLVRPTRRLHDSFMDRLDALIAADLPGMADADRRRSAEVMVQIFRGMVPLIAAVEGAEREAVVVELKRALRAYASTLMDS